MNDALLVTAVTCLLITIIGGVLTQRPPRSSGSDGSDDSAEAEGLGEEAAVITKSDEDQEADALGFREEQQTSRPTSRSLSAQLWQGGPSSQGAARGLACGCRSCS